MKKILTVILVMAFIVMLPMIVSAHTEGDPFVTDLIMDGGSLDTAMDVGDVLVWNDADYLYVKYVVTDTDWCITETHLHVAGEVAAIPQTKNGNPIPGQFDYISINDCVHEYTVMIQNIWDPETPLVIAAHADLTKEVIIDGIVTYLDETGWAAGLDFPGKNWATYFMYVIQAPTPNPECEGATCETFIPCDPAGGCEMPVCATIAEGGGVCVEGTTPCAGLLGCASSADCPGDGLCVVETCCRIPVCAQPEIWCVNIPENTSEASEASDAGPTLGGM